MRLVEYHSHLGAYEHIVVHRPDVWGEITKIIADVEANPAESGLRDREAVRGSYNVGALDAVFEGLLTERGWLEEPPPSGSGAELQPSDRVPLHSYGQPDFVKGRIGIQVQFRRDSAVAYDLFVKHMAFFVGDKIDVGVEIVPMKEMQKDDVSTGPPYYEKELYDLLRQGRSTPAVPLVIVGVAP